MITINSTDELKNLTQDNQFIGEMPELVNSKIIMNGTGNILVCHSSVKLVNSTLNFNGNNSIIYLCENRHPYYLSVSVHNNCVFYMGKNNYINGTLSVILSEQKHCFIGNDCLISFGIWMRNADPHLVYSTQTNKRLNISKSIYIGDHVWIGQSAMILKGSQIDSGSIVGAMSLVAGKRIPHNESWGGNPAKMIATGIFWEGSCVHKWGDAQTKKSMNFAKFASGKTFTKDAYIYNYDKECSISFEDMDHMLSSKNTSQIVEYLNELSENDNHDRFVHNIQIKKKRWLF